jgi:hypothetical protein
MMASEQGLVNTGLEPVHVDRRGVAGIKASFAQADNNKMIAGVPV